MRRVLVAALCAIALSAPAMVEGQDGMSDPLRPGDIIRLRVWGDTLMHGEFPVDERGHVVLPRLGSRDVLALTPQALRDQVVAEYQRMLREPAVEVLTLRRVLVLGAVREPGTHYLPTGHSRLSDALGEAGGVTPEGRQDRVRITRNGDTADHRLGAGLRASDVNLQSGDEVYVPERAWLARNQGVLASLISGGMSIVVALLWMAGG
jgi:protein involved in polysaccharide export with SLBB domain